jgi:hypothetical protein
MEGKSHGNDGAPAGNAHPLPVGEAAPAPATVAAVNPPAPAAVQQNVSTDSQDKQRCTKIQNCDAPLSVRVIKDNELSSFERITVRYGYWGIVFAFVSLVIAIYAADCVFQQFKEMAAQTELLSRGATQARRDSAEASVTTTKQLQIAQEQVKAAEESVDAIAAQTVEDERPWVSMDVVAPSEFNFQLEQEPSITVKFTLTNGGHSVAKYVSVNMALVMDFRAQQAQDRICAIPKARINAKSDYGYLLFPGGTVTDTISTAVTIEDTKRALGAHFFQGMNAIPLDLAFCVDYRSTLDTKHHQTRLIRGVAFRDARRAYIPFGAFEPGHIYENLVLLTHGHGDSAD